MTLGLSLSACRRRAPLPALLFERTSPHPSKMVLKNFRSSSAFPHDPFELMSCTENCLISFPSSSSSSSPSLSSSSLSPSTYPSTYSSSSSSSLLLLLLSLLSSLLLLPLLLLSPSLLCPLYFFFFTTGNSLALWSTITLYSEMNTTVNLCLKSGMLIISNSILLAYFRVLTGTSGL